MANEIVGKVVQLVEMDLDVLRATQFEGVRVSDPVLNWSAEWNPANVVLSGIEDPELPSGFALKIEELVGASQSFVKWDLIQGIHNVGAIALFRAAIGAPVNINVPTIEGFILVGETFTVDDGEWAGAPTSFSYQWKLDGVAIVGETNSTYLVVAADAGKALSVEVTATNATGSTSVESAPTENLVQALRWFDFSDLSTLFQDAVGTTPVTANGQIIRRALDKSGNGNHISRSGGADSGVPTYGTGSGLHWMNFEAANVQSYPSQVLFLPTTDMTEIMGFNRLASGQNCGFIFAGTNPHTAWWFSDDKIYTALGDTESAGSAANSNTGGFVMVSKRDVINEIARLNKVQVSTRASPAISNQFLHIGQTQAGTFMNQRVYGFVMVATSITTAQLESLETSMGVKAGIVI